MKLTRPTTLTLSEKRIRGGVSEAEYAGMPAEAGTLNPPLWSRSHITKNPLPRLALERVPCFRDPHLGNPAKPR